MCTCLSQIQMVQPISRDEHNRPYRACARVIQLDNGLKIDVSNSQYMTRNICQTFINNIHSMVPWHKNFDLYPRTIWRNILCLIILFLRCCVDGILTENWNEYYHATSVPIGAKQLVTENTDPIFCSEYNLTIGQWYWLSPNPLMLVCTGDSYPIPKSPNDVKNGTCCIVKIHVWNHNKLQQTLLTGLPFLLSGLSHSNPAIRQLYHYLIYPLKKNGSLSFYSQRAQCNICVDYYVYHNGDWPWLASVTLGCLSHKSRYPFIYWLHHLNGDFIPVSNQMVLDIDPWFEAIKAGIKEEHMPWNLDLSKIDKTDDFYCLCTESHWLYWQNQMKQFIDKIKNWNQLTDKQKHTKRRNYAIKQSQCVLYDTRNVLIQYIFDVMHLMLRHGISLTCAMTILSHCSFEFSINESLTILKHCSMF